MDDPAWVGIARRIVREILGDKSALLEGVYADIQTPQQLHLDAVDDLREYDPVLANALSQLEVTLDKELQGFFDQVLVHSVPFAALEEDELREMHSGIKLL